MAQVRFGSFRVNLPQSLWQRFLLGIALIIGGLFSFLPVLGLWMLPLGLIVLSVDFPQIRRFRRSATVRFGIWLQKRWPGLGRKIGYGKQRPR